jgi:hypothetical protein
MRKEKLQDRSVTGYDSYHQPIITNPKYRGPYAARTPQYLLPGNWFFLKTDNGSLVLHGFPLED